MTEETQPQPIDENAIAALLDFIRSNYTTHQSIHTKLNYCIRVLEWAKQTKRRNLIVELADALSSHFAHARPEDLNLTDDSSDQVIEAMRQFWEQGRAFASAGLAAAREMGDEGKELGFLINLSRISGYVDDYGMALDCMKHELRLLSQDKKWSAARDIFQLGNRASNQGKYAIARTCYQTSLAAWEELGNKQAMAETLDFLAANETTRIERCSETGEQFSDGLLSVVDSLWKLSDKLRHEAELEQEQHVTKGIQPATHDRLVDDATCKELRTTLAKLNSLG